MDNVRYNISPCEADEVADFIGKIDTDVFVPNGVVRATDKSHYDRYSFLCDDSRVAVVYDTSASIVSITGRQDHARQLLDTLAPSHKSIKRSAVPAQGGNQIKPADGVPHNNNVFRQSAEQSRAKVFVAPDSLRKRNEYKPVPTVFASAKGDMIVTDEIFPPQTIKRKSVNNDRNAYSNFGNGNNNVDGQIFTRTVVNNNNSRSASQVGQPIKRTLTPYGESPRKTYTPIATVQPRTALTEHGNDNSEKSVGLAISIGNRNSDRPRRAVISFGSDDDRGGSDTKSGLKINTLSQTANSGTDEDQPKRKRGRPPKQKKPEESQIKPDIRQSSKNVKTDNEQNVGVQTQSVTPKKRGRPPKNNHSVTPEVQQQTSANAVATGDKGAYEYKNGYSVKNFPSDALDGAVTRLKSYCTVVFDGVEFENTPQEVKSYTVSDKVGQKVILRYATKRRTLQLQGKQTDLFGEVMAQISRDSDYSSALENYVQSQSGKQNVSGNPNKKVSDVQNKLKKRLPTAFAYLSEQSRIDFSYGIHDFGQSGLQLSDYSVLLVPAFRGLERFVFDLQRSEGINVKMIGQAYDKDDSGKYVLKSGYCSRINSVVYAEVMVALYTEYFSQRNFFAHSDNTDNNISRSIPERAAAQKIFDHLLDVVEYNARKLKEIGYTVKQPTL